MADEVKTEVDAAPRRRRYHSPRRAQQAADTRRAVLEAARELFTRRGYAATSVAEIAQRAGVALDTVYATVGRKPALLRELVETSLSGQDAAVPASERDYVRNAIEAPGAHAKLTAYVTGLVPLQQRLAPIFLALRDAATRDPDCAQLWAEVSTRRAANMRKFAAVLRATGELRDDLTDDEIADVIWSMNAPEYYVLLVNERGWTPERFGQWLTDAWTRLLLN
jgi:AcrR family transcriptional regulator